ncbi:MAG: toll/interleukin-1 receptor domain-containing protein [Elusimicrobiota bacterium]|nr:toll/interleukin-1 receptor domain-containing protein [Elusimicrobiota bacterium]
MKVFISHAHEDRQEAAVLHDRLSLLGCECFLAHRDLPGGSKWRDEIVRELKSSDVFIPILTTSALGSAWVHQECGMAHLLRANKRPILIVPVLVGCDAPPGCIAEYQAVKANKQYLGLSDKVKMTDELTLKLAGEIMAASSAPEQLRGAAVASARGAAWNSVEYIVQFLHQTDSLTYSEFVDLIAACRYNFAVASTDKAMWYIFRFLEKHKAEIDRDPAAVKAWNEIYAQYDKRKKDEARRAEEARRESEERQKELARVLAQNGKGASEPASAEA